MSKSFNKYKTLSGTGVELGSSGMDSSSPQPSNGSEGVSLQSKTASPKPITKAKSRGSPYKKSPVPLGLPREPVKDTKQQLGAENENNNEEKKQENNDADVACNGNEVKKTTTESLSCARKLFTFHRDPPPYDIDLSKTGSKNSTGEVSHQTSPPPPVSSQLAPSDGDVAETMMAGPPLCAPSSNNGTLPQAAAEDPLPSAPLSATPAFNAYYSPSLVWDFIPHMQATRALVEGCSPETTTTTTTGTSLLNPYGHEAAALYALQQLNAATLLSSPPPQNLHYPPAHPSSHIEYLKKPMNHGAVLNLGHVKREPVLNHGAVPNQEPEPREAIPHAGGNTPPTVSSLNNPPSMSPPVEAGAHAYQQPSFGESPSNPMLLARFPPLSSSMRLLNEAHNRLGPGGGGGLLQQHLHYPTSTLPPSFPPAWMFPYPAGTADMGTADMETAEAAARVAAAETALTGYPHFLAQGYYAQAAQDIMPRLLQGYYAQAAQDMQTVSADKIYGAQGDAHQLPYSQHAAQGDAHGHPYYSTEYAAECEEGGHRVSAPDPVAHAAHTTSSFPAYYTHNAATAASYRYAMDQFFAHLHAHAATGRLPGGTRSTNNANALHHDDAGPLGFSMEKPCTPTLAPVTEEVTSPLSIKRGKEHQKFEEKNDDKKGDDMISFIAQHYPRSPEVARKDDSMVKGPYSRATLLHCGLTLPRVPPHVSLPILMSRTETEALLEPKIRFRLKNPGQPSKGIQPMEASTLPNAANSFFSGNEARVFSNLEILVQEMGKIRVVEIQQRYSKRFNEWLVVDANKLNRFLNECPNVTLMQEELVSKLPPNPANEFLHKLVHYCIANTCPRHIIHNEGDVTTPFEYFRNIDHVFDEESMAWWGSRDKLAIENFEKVWEFKFRGVYKFSEFSKYFQKNVRQFLAITPGVHQVGDYVHRLFTDAHDITGILFPPKELPKELIHEGRTMLITLMSDPRFPFLSFPAHEEYILIHPWKDVIIRTRKILNEHASPVLASFLETVPDIRNGIKDCGPVSLQTILAFFPTWFKMKPMGKGEDVEVTGTKALRDRFSPPYGNKGMIPERRSRGFRTFGTFERCQNIAMIQGH